LDGPCSWSNSPCGSHGSTCTPLSLTTFTCTCKDGWGGALCNYKYACNPSPCQNGGTCSAVLGANAYTCACAQGYEGATCALNVNDCPGNVCMNGATCVDGLNSYTCSCTPYFTKDSNNPYCTIDVNECIVTPAICGPGNCTNTISTYVSASVGWSLGFTCACQPGGNPLAASPCKGCLYGWRTSGGSTVYCNACLPTYTGWPSCVPNH